MSTFGFPGTVKMKEWRVNSLHTDLHPARSSYTFGLKLKGWKRLLGGGTGNETWPNVLWWAGTKSELYSLMAAVRQHFCPLLLLVSSPAHHFTKQTGVPADVSVVTWEGRTWPRFRRSRSQVTWFNKVHGTLARLFSSADCSRPLKAVETVW